MSTVPSPATISPQQLHALLCGDDELALLDVREARSFVGGHLNLARLAPLSSLALAIGALVPRPGTPLVLVDDGEPEGPAARAAQLLARLGYTDLRLLAGGITAWRQAGLPLIDGYASLVKAFGGQVLARHGTPVQRGAVLRAGLVPDDASPSRAADAIDDADRAHSASAVLIDARPADEHAYLSLPGASNHPGTELALRDWDADAPGRPWVVHCFSRTRGIIGSTSLRLLGHPDARFLEDGVMQWALDGAQVRQEAAPAADLPLAAADELQRRADALLARHPISLIAPDELQRLRAQSERSLYVFDLRPGAIDGGAALGVRAVAGGQLLMHFEQLVGTRGARIVLLDDAPHRLRAVLTAFWLQQLNQAEVLLLDGELPAGFVAEAGFTHDPFGAAGEGIEAAELAELAGMAMLVDVGPSADFEREHLPGAFFMLPASLEPLAPSVAANRHIVFISPDGRAARWVASEARTRWPGLRIDWLRGGTAAWRAAGRPTESGRDASRLLTPFADHWGSVMRVSPRARARVWADYLAWERGLSARVAGDATVRFRLA